MRRRVLLIMLGLLLMAVLYLHQQVAASSGVHLTPVN